MFSFYTCKECKGYSELRDCRLKWHRFLLAKERNISLWPIVNSDFEEIKGQKLSVFSMSILFVMQYFYFKPKTFYDLLTGPASTTTNSGKPKSKPGSAKPVSNLDLLLDLDGPGVGGDVMIPGPILTPSAGLPTTPGGSESQG